MPLIMSYLVEEKSRTTDFSYGGVYMWINYFHYEYAIVADTLFIKGRVENDRTRTAFSLPIGRLPLAASVAILKQYCHEAGIPLLFSAVPEEYAETFRALGASSVEPLEDWSDYLYDASQLASLSGKKMAKKRNHVHQFENACPDWSIEPLTPENASEALAFMDIFDGEGDNTPAARAERLMTRRLINHFSECPELMEGALLRAGEKVCAFTIGDIKDDTLFVHVEKATRVVPGSYEAVNAYFARMMIEKYPQLKYINREDDAGDEGLRRAKQSYHPLTLLRKYNVTFPADVRAHCRGDY